MNKNLRGESLPLASTSLAATPSPRGKPLKPQIICLTGKMAAGKNYIASKLMEEGALSLDLDQTAHQAIEMAKSQIIEAFSQKAKEMGIELQNPDGSLNRRELGKIVFSSPELLKKQEDLVYPKIIELCQNFIKENAGKDLILNATVLYKTPGLLKMCTKILFVTANPIKRFFRAKKRDKMKSRQILSRFRSQRGLLQEYKKLAQELKIPLEIIKN